MFTMLPVFGYILKSIADQRQFDILNFSKKLETETVSKCHCMKPLIWKIRLDRTLCRFWGQKFETKCLGLPLVIPILLSKNYEILLCLWNANASTHALAALVPDSGWTMFWNPGCQSFIKEKSKPQRNFNVLYWTSQYGCQSTLTTYVLTVAEQRDADHSYTDHPPVYMVPDQSWYAFVLISHHVLCYC